MDIIYLTIAAAVSMLFDIIYNHRVNKNYNWSKPKIHRRVGNK